MPIRNAEIPGFFCSDPEVQAYCEAALWDFNAYGPSMPWSASELFQAARRRFGDYRCWDLEIQPQ